MFTSSYISNRSKFRFSPSPSGYLHIGGLRSASFNWFLAKKFNATFLVRVEDTDQDRSTPESEKIILDSLRWMGIDWQEGIDVGGAHGPYRQSERKDIYQYYAEKLIKEGKAYRCYCTAEELDAQRQLLAKSSGKAQFKYPGACRDKKDDPSIPHVIRFKTSTEGSIEYDDIVFGHISTPNKENQDFIIVRSNGFPTYNWSAALDDHLMGITHIVRGREHMINTPLQVMIYDAFGWEFPNIASLPLMLDQERKKLSKRMNSVSVFEYRDAGYSPAAILSYLSKFGWSHGDKELFSIDELIEKFSLENCGKADGCFDPVKFSSIQYSHLKSTTLTPTAQYARHTIPFLKANGIDVSLEQVETAIPLIRERSKTFIEAAKELDPILREVPVMDHDAYSKFITVDNKPQLSKLHDFLSTIEEWNVVNLKDSVASWLTSNSLTIKDVGQPIRILLSGRTQSPDLFAVMEMLGKTMTLQRMKL